MSLSAHFRLSVALAFAIVWNAPSSHARDFIRIVGSSTVFPFSALAAEEFSLKTPYPTPIIEQLGTGGGLKLFCGGLGTSGRFDYPDIANASRAIKPVERALCAQNGISDILEIRLGDDGIVLAHSASSKQFSLSTRQLYLALARRVPTSNSLAARLIENPYERWSQIDPRLPNEPILIYGPPASSGTRDAFLAAVMDKNCQAIDASLPTDAGDQAKTKPACRALRTDGRFIEVGENDNVIVQRLRQAPGALGILPFAIVDQNLDLVKPTAIDGIVPTRLSIAANTYSIARPLYIYVKSAHARTVPGLADFLAEFLSENALGPYGYLTEVGLVTLPLEGRSSSRKRARSLSELGPIGVDRSGNAL
ncbi:MAG: substrate-binding domain-containing protein [Pseudomonadota bacterium]